MNRSHKLFTLLLLVAFAGTASARVTGTTSKALESRPASLIQGDNSLEAVRRADLEARSGAGSSQLSAAEHLRRGQVYLTNRAFEEARAHFLAIVQQYPTDTNVPAALFGVGRSYFLPHFYEQSLAYFERVAREFPQTKDGREGLNSSAAALLRMGRAAEAVARYREYVEKYPRGERIDSVYLNIIDGLREAGQPQEAINWIARTREKFPRTVTERNAMFARLRLDVAEGDWNHALAAADELRQTPLVGFGLMTSYTEIAYLRAYSLERAGRAEEAISAYMAIPDTAESYFGSLATARLLRLVDASRRTQVTARLSRVQAEIASAASLYPAPFREQVLRASLARKLDPRLVLAIMKQES
ncbi:MAG TPA: tetratricopeptide repeat protein, partial [Pyrinomonadaceae bacterium]